VSFTTLKDLDLIQKRFAKKIERIFKRMKVLLPDEGISRIYEESGLPNDILHLLEDLVKEKGVIRTVDYFVSIHLSQLYQEISQIVTMLGDFKTNGVRPEASVHTKYKTVAKKVKPVATQLPCDIEEHIKQAENEPSLRETRKIGHKFTEETLARLKIGGDGFFTESEKKKFQDMLSIHGKAFVSSPDEIGCVQPSVVAPMVIFTEPHVPCDLKPIPVPRTLLPKLVKLLKEKIHMDIF
jgi:hypothetical protein